MKIETVNNRLKLEILIKKYSLVYTIKIIINSRINNIFRDLKIIEFLII